MSGIAPEGLAYVMVGLIPPTVVGWVYAVRRLYSEHKRIYGRKR